MLVTTNVVMNWPPGPTFLFYEFEEVARRCQREGEEYELRNAQAS